jgi:protein-disulfide isomerase
MIKTRWVALLLLFFANGMTAPMSLAATGHRPVAADWTRTVMATPDGFRMGNPKAKVAIVEYFSFTCPHCAAFAAEALPKLRDDYIRSGAISFEARLALRDRADFVAAMTARCGGTRAFFPLYEALFATQGDWISKSADYDSAHPSDLQGAGGAGAMAALATGSGLDAIAKAQGVTPAALKRCYGDAAARATLERTTRDAWTTRPIGGTPGFLLNDQLLDGVHTWAALQPRIAEAVTG